MTNDYTVEAQEVASAMNSVYENKQQNKKTDISGDFSSDTASYPTVQATKNHFGNKVASWSNNPSDINYPSEKLTKNALDGKANTTHSHTATEMTDANANQYTYIGTLSANATQQAINNAINTAFSNITGLQAIVITTDKGTASASTMGKLYIVNENQKVNVYYTVQSGSTYTWHKMDVDMLDEYVVNWNDVQNKPSTFAPSSHQHGALSNDGKIGSTANLPLITTTAGAITTGIFGTSSGTFAEGNHTHSSYTTTGDVQSEIQTFATALASAINPSK